MRTYSDGPPVGVPVVAGRDSWALPDQDQGEGVALDGDDLLVSTEGARSQVLRVGLPASGRRDRPALARVDEPALARDGVRLPLPAG